MPRDHSLDFFQKRFYAAIWELKITLALGGFGNKTHPSFYDFKLEKQRNIYEVNDIASFIAWVNPSMLPLCFVLDKRNLLVCQINNHRKLPYLHVHVHYEQGV